MLGSLRVPFSQVSIALVVLAVALLSLVLVRRDGPGLKAFFVSRRKEILITEGIALAFFLLDLAIRLGNPDLWHPSKGGEKPMDLSYLTAVLRSTSFPPYDPWFAGGYINYYYYGFVLIGIPIRLLGMMPTIGYNLVIPTLFALLALTAYSVAYNLVARGPTGETRSWRGPSPRVAGIAAALAIVVLGNLGTLHMIYEGFKRIGTAEGEETGTALVGAVQAARGALRFATLESGLPYGLDSWYWDPSRSIPAENGEPGPITEFPFFTFLYADLHAHMISRPVALLCLGWMLSWLLAADRGKPRKPLEIVAGLFIGGLAFGAIRPTNLSDYPTYWGMGAVAAAAAPWLRERKITPRVVVEGALYAVLLLGLSYALYYPYYAWYGQAYGSVAPWTGSTTPLSAYFIVYGLFLFVLLSWLAHESVDWMSTTPVSSLKRLRPYTGVISLVAVIVLAAMLVLAARHDVVALVVLPVIAWAGVLFLRPGTPLEKRLALVLFAAGAALTLLVEVVVSVGDIGRMNTVFKFYLQVWEMFGIAGAAALYWLLSAGPSWRPPVRQVWGIAFWALAFSAALYPVVASIAKIRDRWQPDAPHSLDGMEYMPYVTYHDIGSTTLTEDAAAIHWLQEQVRGTPVIVEAHVPEYRWGSRMTIYTGLPSVLGWNWHQRQQRVLGGDMEVWERAWDVEDFYLTRSTEEASTFLEKYGVTYIVVGRLERMYYETLYPCSAGDGGVTCDMSNRLLLRDCSNACAFEIPIEECARLDPQGDPATLSCPSGGLDKFDRMVEAGLLRVAFREGQTVIYEVVR
jgi:YYY domain-containing protein